MLFDKLAAIIFLEGNLQLFLGIHDDGTVPGDRLVQRLAGNKQEPDRPVGGGHLHLVAFMLVENHGLGVADAPAFHIELAMAHHLIGISIATVVEIALPVQHVGKGLMAGA